MDSLKRLFENVLNTEYFSISTSRLTIGLILTLIVVWITNMLKNWLKFKNYFKKLNIPGPSPKPLFGNFLDVVKKGIPEYDIEIIKKHGKIVGYFEGSTPVIITTDLKFIKNVMIKDFSSFVNRRSLDSLLVEPTDKFMSLLKDEEWKNVRTIVTTAFSSGKLKSMSKCMLYCIKNFEEYLETLTEKGDSMLDTKKYFGGFTLDVISSCCFGIDVNSIKEPDNEFIKNLQIIFGAQINFNPKILLLFLFPKLSMYLAKKGLIEFFPMKTLRFFEKVVNPIIQRRKDKTERREDFIQNIVDHEEVNNQEDVKQIQSTDNDETKRTTHKWNSTLKKTLTDKEILAQAILFLIAGYEATSTTLCFIAYNLATNFDCQQKLLEEIDSVLDKHNGEINYDSISGMVYMDMVIDETLRMFPPATRTDRVASEDYNYNGIHLEKGLIWSVPIWALHHDPEIYPEPDKFIPERFDEKNKKNIDNLAFIPFGAGPRNCIGMRFALIEIKLLLATILSKYQFEKCDKTPEKIVIDKSGFARSKDPIILKVNRR